MLVTVLMSVYNSEQYLDKAIESILNQTYRDFEFIIIDDGSKDNSKNIIRNYAGRDSRIIFLENEKNLGLARSLNKGIQLARGKYIARQDADDLSAAERLATQLEYALEHPEVDMIGSDCFVIDIADNIVYEDNVYSHEVNHFDNLLKNKALFPHGSAFLKKEKLLEVGLYDPRFYYVQDGEFWLRLISHGARVHIVNQPLYFYRTAPDAFTKRGNAKRLFNKVMRMTYADKEDAVAINAELEKISAYLGNAELKARPFYMAKYWKSLANAAYFNSGAKSSPFKYISKALKEKNSILSYPHYLLLCLLYFLPSSMVKQVMRMN